MTAMQQVISEGAVDLTVDIDPGAVGSLLDKEWLLTNRRGSYASGTVIGCNTRRYHGLLVASLHPPVERVVTLSNMLETLRAGGQFWDLANFEFSDRLHPEGYRYLKTFRRHEGVQFAYEVGGFVIEKSLYLAYEHDQIVLSYDIQQAPEAATLELMPMIALRDFHWLQSSSAPLCMESDHEVVTIHGIDHKGPAVHMACPRGRFEQDGDWWYAMHYRAERNRGMPFSEDVWVPGVFRCSINGPTRIRFVAQATSGWGRPGPLEVDFDDFVDRLQLRRTGLHKSHDIGKSEDEIEQLLVEAADQFIVRRKITHNGHETESTTILAGYPWFADWGRDTFIALPGLLLCTERFEEARQVLRTFAGVVDRGQIPNRFDDYGGPPHYNSVDASLWFINAAYQYRQITQDHDTYNAELLPVIRQIIAAYRRGTRDNIHADADGLIIAGDERTQLTWMDAKCEGTAFTPRYGKPVEVNALWINALSILDRTETVDADQEKLKQELAKTEEAFRHLFWNPKIECLNDCILPDGAPDEAIRPNQIFAVSLPFSCLTRTQQLSTVHIVQEHLLTDYGLRSLSPRDSRFRDIYEGDQYQRDSAYHQGTVWAFLMGPFVEAWLKAHGHTAESRRQAQLFLEPLWRHLREDACLGSVSEIFDGRSPHQPKGCIAQAWSVAELLRCRVQLLKN